MYHSHQKWRLCNGSQLHNYGHEHHQDPGSFADCFGPLAGYHSAFFEYRSPIGLFYGVRLCVCARECYDGKTYTNITDMFRAYSSIEDAVEDYYDMLAFCSRYLTYILACRV